jgi:transcriptional regulator with PAS, ATPase and Fis domain
MPTVLKGIASLCIAALRLADKLESIRDARDLLQEEQPELSDIVGESAAIQAVLDQTRNVAGFDATVLIRGETGTGKEIIARKIHEMSTRHKNPFVAVNCGAIPESLLESELFGHAKGGFTGATAARKGKFRMANGGTIFLDEIGEMGLEAQTRLLRVLQEGVFSPVGDDAEVEIDVRVVAATNVNLEEAVRQKKFREDLFYRLNVVPIEVPPLRERRDDIPLLARHFLRKYQGWRLVENISPDAMEILMSHEWRGNVRELENIVQAAIVNGGEETIQRADLPKYILAPKPAAGTTDLKGKGRAVAKKVQRADILARMKATGETAEQAGAHFGFKRAWTYRLLAEDE